MRRGMSPWIAFCLGPRLRVSRAREMAEMAPDPKPPGVKAASGYFRLFLPAASPTPIRKISETELSIYTMNDSLRAHDVYNPLDFLNKVIRMEAHGPKQPEGCCTPISTKYGIGLPSKRDSEILTTDLCNACAGPVFYYRRVPVQGERGTTERRTGASEYTYSDVIGRASAGRKYGLAPIPGAPLGLVGCLRVDRRVEVIIVGGR